MPVKEKTAVEEVSSSSGSSSNSSSSGSDSSSSNSSSSDDSSSDDDSASSSSSPNKNNRPSPTTTTPSLTSTNPKENHKKAETETRSRSYSSSRSRSRSQSRASSVTSVSSAKSKTSAKKSQATKKVTSTTSSNPKSSKPPDQTNKTVKKKSHVAAKTNNKAVASSSVASGSKAPVPKKTDGSEERKSHQSNSKSKVVKSGTVTNARTIKPLSSSSSSSSLKKTVPIAGKTPPVPVHRIRDIAEKAEGIVKKTNMGITGKKKPVANKMSSDNDKPSHSEGRKLEANKKQGKTLPTKIPSKEGSGGGGMKTRASSCSSASASTSSSVDSSGDDEPEDSSVTESSPSKPNGHRSQNRKVLPTNTRKKSEASKQNMKKASVIRNLANEMLSSADEGDDGKMKKNQPHQRRPLTRRQKSGVKKTIPTTTLFNQSLLLATTSGDSPSGPSPKKASVTVATSSAADLPLARFPTSAIISRRSTTNSSAVSSSETESTGGQKRKKLPFSSLTTQSSSKNKYLSTWDSDFSDDNFNQHLTHSAANFIRVPAKTSNRPRTFDFSQSLLDPDSYEPPRCPFPSCDSNGHLSGKYPNHNFLSCCPSYHGFEPSECTENEEERSHREAERLRYRNILTTPGKKPPKPTSETKVWLNSMKDLRESQANNGLVSGYDNLLWKDALAISAERVEKEQNEGINNQGMYYRLSMAVAMGRFEMKCWCASPYPEPLSQNRRLFVCEFCLKPVASGTVLRRHCAKCVWRHPPGDEIYRKDRLSVWEVDGKKQKTYCQNLCLLAKCFLDHKTLYLDVDPFLFYVMTLADNQGCHLVGYFSKEKNSFLNYNVSCILTLPPYMRQGFGRLLIDFSYLLTRVEGKVGSPEKPLSDLGLISYRSYWKDAVLRRLCACASREINIKDLSIELGVSTADLISTLQFLGMLKYWKGKHLVLKKQDVLEEYLERVRRRGNERQIDSSCLRWRPYQPPPDEHSSSEKS